MKPKYFLLLVILAAAWGSSFLFIRISVDEFGPVPLSAMRTLVAATFLAPILFVPKHWAVFKANWQHLLVLGLISTALPFSLMSITSQFTSAGFASILNALTPIFSAIVAWLWLKEYLSIPAVIGIGLSFLGVLAMVMDTHSISSEYLLLPILTGVLASALYGLTGNYSRKFLIGLSPFAISAGCQFFSALLLLPAALFYWPETPISASSWLCAVVLGVFCTGMGYIAFFHLLEKIGVAKTIIVTYLVPVFAMTWGVLFLDETVTTQMFAGAACILIGITLTTGILKKRQKRIYEKN